MGILFDAPWILRVVSAVGLVFLAVYFGKTLRHDGCPLIEQVAKVSTPHLSPALRLYTRRLTALWSVWFAVAALIATVGGFSFGATGLMVWTGTIILFLGEYFLRCEVLFTAEKFPGIGQQVRDTLSVWQRRA